MYKVSRPTAREAFLALELVGAVEVRHGDGTFVSDATTRGVSHRRSLLETPPRELIESRCAIEPVSTGLAASRITTERIDALERNLAEQEGLVDDPIGVPRFVELGLEFHSELAPGCGNSLLADIVQQLVNGETHPLWALVNQQMMPDAASRQRQVDEHRAVLDAVRSGDAERAADAMRGHLGDLSDRMFVIPTARAGV